jgi:hypothetical protein
MGEWADMTLAFVIITWGRKMRIWRISMEKQLLQLTVQIVAVAA